MQTSENLQLFTAVKFVQASDESPFNRGACSGGRGIARQHAASVTIPAGVREMCGCSIGTMVQESLVIRAIIIVLARLRD